MSESITVQMDRILDEYRERVDNVSEVATDRVARETVRRLRATSPKRPGHGEYARGWRLKRLKQTAHIVDVIVHNATDYQLTHLLNNGHRVVNKYGEYGSTKGDDHITNVEEWANEELPREIERELR